MKYARHKVKRKVKHHMNYKWAYITGALIIFLVIIFPFFLDEKSCTSDSQCRVVEATGCFPPYDAVNGNIYDLQVLKNVLVNLRLYASDFECISPYIVEPLAYCGEKNVCALKPDCKRTCEEIFDYGSYPAIDSNVMFFQMFDEQTGCYCG